MSVSDRGLGRGWPGDDEAAQGPPPAVIGRVFGAHGAKAAWYAELLRTEGVKRGLIGPRENDRIWHRHILNCAVVAELIPGDVRVLDAGSGAGLPGVAIAIARPDLEIVLLDAQSRRTEFLSECVRELALTRVTVRQSRIEDEALRRELGPIDVVVARALAPLDRLSRWCLPVLSGQGRLLAMKGSSASDEVSRHRAALGRYGASEVVIQRCGIGIVEPETTVVDVRVGGRGSSRGED